ncbi:MAG: hypothetical protein GY754_03525 [bacterium]|nr:hypothetical protein [bacterium]
MNRYPVLPTDIYTKLGINFVNPVNRAIANQSPYSVNKKTIYVNNNTNFKELFENTLEPTVWILRNNKGEFLDSFFIPRAVDDDPYKRIIHDDHDDNISNRLLSFLKNY